MQCFQKDEACSSISAEVLRVGKLPKKKPTLAKLYVMVWVELMYELWLSRCHRLYGIKNISSQQAARNVLFRVSVRVGELEKNLLLI